MIIEKNKQLYFLSFLVAIFSLISVLSPAKVFANVWGTNGGGCGNSCYMGNVTWEKTNFRSANDIVQTTIGPMTLRDLFAASGNDSQLGSFLSSDNQWLVQFNGQFTPKVDWNIYTGNLATLPGLTHEQTMAYYAELVSQGYNPQFPFQIHDKDGRFDVPGGNSPRPNNYWLSCDVGSGPKFKYTTSKKVINRENSVSGDYSYYVTITPVKPIGFESLSDKEKEDWYATHKEQRTTPKLTDFGNYVKDYNMGVFNSSNNSSMSDWQSFKSTASQKAQQKIDFELELSPENKKGFQRGGVFTVTVMTKSATVYTSTEDEYLTTDTYSCAYYDTGKKDDNGRTIYRSYYEHRGSSTRLVIKRAINPETVQSGGNTSFTLGSTGNTGYVPKYSYQILNVRCNRSAFNELVSNTGSSNISYGNGSSSTAQSPTVNNSVATFFNNVNTAFFYKGQDCDFKCFATPTSQSATVNDASNNIQNRGDNSDKFGAQNSDKNSNDKFSFFRDNTVYYTRLDVWHPDQLGSDVTYDKDGLAFKTTITLDTTGTPQGDLFRLLDSSNNELLSGQNLKSVSSITLDGQLNNLGWQGAYSSEKGKEHRANVFYAYKIKLKTTVPVLGSDRVKATPALDSEDLDISCLNTYNTTDGVKATIYGTPSESGYKPNTSFSKTNNKYLTVGFVKSSIE